MADKSPIEWTDATWNPIVGCDIVSPGCTNCYAMDMAARIEAMSAGLGRHTHYEGTTRRVKGKAVWTGRLALAPERIRSEPLRWKRPRMVFVNSMGDLFHEHVPDEWIDRVFAVMAEAHWHTYQVLTKRSKRMHDYLSAQDVTERIGRIQQRDHGDNCAYTNVALDAIWPLRNAWLGVSAERQEEADERIPDLLATPAAIRFVSAEPLLGPIDFTRINLGVRQTHGYGPRRIEWDALTGWEHQFPADSAPGCDPLKARVHGIGDCGAGAKLDWIIVGGESGPHARPMHPDWARSIRDQCAAAGVPFFFKQWGGWVGGGPGRVRWSECQEVIDWGDGCFSARVGKHRADRLLDGVEHDGMPQAKEVPAL